MRNWRNDPDHLAAHVQRMGYTQRFFEIQRMQRRRPVHRYERRGFRWSLGPQVVKR